VTNLWDDMLGACQGSGWENLMELGWNAGCPEDERMLGVSTVGKM
jgi:hypothetical protein